VRVLGCRNIPDCSSGEVVANVRERRRREGVVSFSFVLFSFV
jgi:hypothetical protein